MAESFEPEDVGRLVGAICHAWQGGQEVATRLCFPQGCDWKSRVPLVEAAIKSLESGSRMHGDRCTLHDEMAATLRAVIQWGNEARAFEEEHQRGGKRSPCRVCPGGMCDQDEDHVRRTRLHYAKGRPQAHDLMELHRDQLIAECDRLRRLLPLRQARPGCPAWVEEAAEMTVLRAWHLSFAGKDREWNWKSPCGLASIWRTEEKEAGARERWLVAVLTPDGSGAESDECASVEEAITFAQERLQAHAKQSELAP